MSNAVLCQMVQNTIYLRKQLEILEKKDKNLIIEDTEKQQNETSEKLEENVHQEDQVHGIGHQTNKSEANVLFKEVPKSKDVTLSKPLARLGEKHVISERNRPSISILPFLNPNRILRKPSNFKPKNSFTKGRCPREPHGVSHMFPKRTKKR